MPAVNVVKRDKSTEAFQPQKIVNTCVKAGLSPDIALKVAEEISSKVHPNIPTHEIKKMVIKELERHEPGAAKQYKAYEKTKKIVVRNNYI
jgi:transcriptional regulator NrdR family protein